MFLIIWKNSQENNCQNLFFNKFGGLRPAVLLKKRLRHRCFLVSFAKFLETISLMNIFKFKYELRQNPVYLH